MAWVDASYVGGSSGATPAHQVGDLIVVVATRWSTSAPTSVGSGFTDKGSFAGTYAMRIGWKVATATNDSTGTWGSATSLYVGIWRGPLGLGAVAALSSSTTAQLPGITLQQPGSSLVGTFATAASAQAPTPAGCVSRWTDGNDRWADTNAAVSSWPAQSLSPQILAVSMELIPATTHVTGELLPVGASSGGHVTGELLPVGATAEILHVTGELVRIGAQASAHITGELVAVGATAESFGTWRELILTSAWLEAVDAPSRTLSARAELVDANGVPQPVIVGREEARTMLPVSGASIQYRGEQAESWQAEITFSDPWMIPRTPSHPLMGYQQYGVRLWWGVKVDGNILEMPVCTVALGNVTVNDDGTVSGNVRGRDVLSLARGGYGQPLNVGGLTCDEAIRAIFERVAPTLPLRIATTTVTLPADMILHEQDPAQDWTDIAAMGWPEGVVRSDREGVIVIGPRPDPTLELDWQEGPDCPVIDLSRQHGIEHMGNQITVSSTHVDAVGLYVTEQDDDPSSPTYVGGPMGIRPLPGIETDKATTEEGLRSLALMHLGRGLHPVEDVDLTVPQRPDLEYQQRVRVVRELSGVDSTYRVSSWSMVLPVSGGAPAPMSVGMMARTVRHA